MSSFRADIALAAARTRMLAEQLPDSGRDELVVEWADALDKIEGATTARAAERALSGCGAVFGVSWVALALRPIVLAPERPHADTRTRRGNPL